MIAVGEESGSLETTLGNLNRVYQEKVDTLVGSLSSMFEYLIMIVLSSVVGFLVVSIYMSIFQIDIIIKTFIKNFYFKGFYINPYFVSL